MNIIATKKRRARIRQGALVGMDFRYWEWPDLPHGIEDMIFEVEDSPTAGGYEMCRADNFGFFTPIGNYGNGPLFVKCEDLIDKE